MKGLSSSPQFGSESFLVPEAVLAPPPPAPCAHVRRSSANFRLPLMKPLIWNSILSDLTSEQLSQAGNILIPAGPSLGGPAPPQGWKEGQTCPGPDPAGRPQAGVPCPLTVGGVHVWEMTGILIACGPGEVLPTNHILCHPAVPAQTPRCLEGPHSCMSPSDLGDGPAAVQRAAALSMSICLITLPGGVVGHQNLHAPAGSEAACFTRGHGAVLERS